MLVVAPLLAAPVAGCSTSAQLPGTTVTVTPRTSVADQPVQIRVAGLVVRSLVPYQPYGPATVAAEGTTSFQADQEADAQLWPRLLSFLASL